MMGDTWSSTIYPEEYEYWLIFANQTQLGTFSTSCSHSTQLTDNKFTVLPPLHPNEKVTDDDVYNVLGLINRKVHHFFSINETRTHALNYNFNNKIEEQNLVINELKESLFVQRILIVIIILVCRY